MIEQLKLIVKIYPNKSIAVLVVLTLVLISSGILFFYFRNKVTKEKLFLTLSRILSIVGFGIFILLMVFVQWRGINQLKRSHVKENIHHHTISKYTFGIDVSHYQGQINWKEVKRSQHPIQFVYIRATMGKNGQDRTYKKNIEAAEKEGFLVGSYHFYRSNENSTKQFENFQQHLKLTTGHLVPVLDVEHESKFGSANLRSGVKNFLELMEESYGVKPIIYTGLHFYNTHLKGHFNDYPLWIAAYSGKSKVKNINWKFHQYSENLRVKGILGNVDANNFNGTLEELKRKFVLL